jgi:DmsE family decaheme c-type cytochrome
MAPAVRQVLGGAMNFPLRAQRGAVRLAFLCGFFMLSFAATLAPSLVYGADDLVYKGDAKCTRCHNEDSTYPVLSIGKTRHGTVADKRTPTCTTCHGESEPHTVKLPEGQPRVKPERYFSKKSATPIEVQNRTCLDCHQGGKRIHWQSSAHATSDISCTACHTVHSAHEPVRDRLTQADTCFACHKEQRVQINRPWHHPVKEGKVTCSDCHNTHGSAGPAMMVRDSINATCATCHMEKRGPFVRNHQPVQENCALCHEPHGSTNPGMLQARVPFLCHQCHDPYTHTTVIPGSINLGGQLVDRSMILARGCSNCHTNVHGTNNPANSTSAGTFRR